MVAQSPSLPAQNSTEEQDNTSTNSEANQAAAPVVALRNKKPPKPIAEPQIDNLSSAHAALERAMGTINSGLVDEDDADEIRRLDSQLDHLNEYMDKVEERLRSHNAKLVETLNQQKQEREKRRQSFHERQQTSRQEDDDFQKQLAELLGQISMSKKRTSILADLDLSPSKEQ
ncbi:unnamed protein product [Bursaphelenchus xylophilus]|uniref:(pine wood nematode) hypothetical protein n=1 Tax=Bursaphelenchus xylophilus TaxID=6326 RepID=A0A1I7S9N3_BURXY|nr:unnamed protein product [Bursaphelenchus xylophilus]CAG9131920.1 unnamed protein product [Bursaphelenchus xylophilus]